KGVADFPKSRQLVHRAGQIARPGLQLGEQPHVLDRDHRLISEGAQELDLRAGEGLDLVEDDRSDDVLAPQHRPAQKAPIAHRAGELPGAREPFLSLDVRYVQGYPVRHDPRGYACRPTRDWVE